MVFGPSGIVDRPSGCMSARNITLYGCIYRLSRYRIGTTWPPHHQVEGTQQIQGEMGPEIPTCCRLSPVPFG